MKSFVLSNGLSLPGIGYGTFRVQGAELISECINEALDSGYRLIDTASVYRNHREIANALDGKDLKVFTTSKLSPKQMGYEKATKGVEEALRDLKRSVLDCFLIHWPGVAGLDATDPRNSVLRLETWKVLEQYYEKGTLKSIGVSNFEVRHLEELLQDAKIVPHINQVKETENKIMNKVEDKLKGFKQPIHASVDSKKKRDINLTFHFKYIKVECHPHYPQAELSKYCASKGIHLQAYSSLGTTIPSNDPSKAGIKPLLQDVGILKVSENCKKSPAQVLLRWGIQKGYGVLPKSVTKSRIRENMDIFDFEISRTDMSLLDNLSINHKYAWSPSFIV